LNVIIINDYASIHGGADQVAITEACGLAALGHNVTFVHAVDEPASENLKASGVKVIRVAGIDARSGSSKIRAAFWGLWNPVAAKQIRQILADFLADNSIVHLHGWSKALSPSVLAAIRTSGLPIVATFHDYIAACPNGAFFDYRSSQICSRTPLGASCVLCNCDRKNYSQKLWRIVRQYILKLVAHFPSRFPNGIVVSRFSEAILSKNLPRGMRLFLLANPIDMPRMPPVDVTRNNTFSFVGRLAQEKGAHILAAAAAGLSAPVRFIGAGEESSKLLSICPRAEITGWKGRGEVTRLLSESRAFVFPSLWYEAQGLGPIEAAALGVPAIVSDTCSATDSVQNGITGFHFRAGDIDDLRRAMVAIGDPAVASRLGRNAYDSYWNNAPTPERHARALQSIYQQISGAATCIAGA
jgi:glycosyltransferase involved in cell wall biosynthesis